MKSYKNWYNIAGWLVFSIALIVYYFSAERVGSLWDVGEFITGAYKLQVVHPPGAPLFLLIGRMFTLPAEWFSDNPENISFAVNLMSGVCTAFMAAFVCWITIMLGKLSLVGREDSVSEGQAIALVGAGIAGGLTSAFCTSIWFSAVEGEVYAMSTFFTALTIWSVVKWYSLPDEGQHDRWLVFAVYAAGLSIGVHLLSMLTFPALALFYYFKKYQKHNLLGMVAAAGIGVLAIVLIQKFIIVGIPQLWAWFDIMLVNAGMPVHSGIIPTLLIIAGIVGLGLQQAHKRGSASLQKVVVALSLVVISFSTLGVVVIRANANTPINMNDPSDATRLLPYLNREQYGERPLLYGPDFDAQPIRSNTTPRYGLVNDRYEIVDEKVAYEYDNKDKRLFPRMGDYSQSRPELYKRWMKSWGSDNKTPKLSDNIQFLFNYQLGWMYWRYFMWNFSGRQNAEQGYYSWDVSSGNWASGVQFIDEMRLHNMSEMPKSMREDEGRNSYYMLPFLFGLLGLLFHFQKRPNDALGLLALFIITGIGIIIYSNQPPNEPRERDYVLAGSFFTYSIWVGMAVLALFEIIKQRAKLSGNIAAGVAAALVLIAPVLMGTQNFDDHSRLHHTGSRDYASNFLNSVEENAIIFTYGDNDTYPLWYAQEVEGIRTDVRVVNLSLIAVDWYIDQLRRKVNDSPPIDMTITAEKMRGRKRVITPYFNGKQDPNNYDPNKDELMSLKQFIAFIGQDNKVGTGARTYESHFPTRRLYIPVNKQQVIENGTVSLADSAKIVDRINFRLDKSSLIKDELAILDIIANNAFKRPIYFAVTCQPSKMMNLRSYMQLEGLALRIIPVKSESDRIYSVIGSGRVATEIAYDNVMNKFRWGSFDEYDLHVDRSYMPSIQSHRLMMLRTASALLDEGQKDKAVAMTEQYLEAFPHENFPYDFNAMYFIDVMIQAGAYDKAKPHLRLLAQETAEYLDFYTSLSEADLNSFDQDYKMAMTTTQQLFRLVQREGDDAFLQELNGLLGAYRLSERDLE
ncbi:MAG: DUF2723 domain-containing protein [Bacteroidota bacterium]